MATILTVDEAARVLRTDTTDALMGDMLPQVDAFIEQATGRDWTVDTVIEPVAKAAARILLVTWFENPGMAGSGGAVLSAGLRSTLAQLEALALKIAEEAETP